MKTRRFRLCFVACLGVPLSLAGCGASDGSNKVDLGDAGTLTLTVEPAHASKPVGQTQRFRAIATVTDGGTADVSEYVSWKSSKPSVATIDAHTGVATAVAPGTVEISATRANVTATATFTVTSGADSGSGGAAGTGGARGSGGSAGSGGSGGSGGAGGTGAVGGTGGARGDAGPDDASTGDDGATPVPDASGEGGGPDAEGGPPADGGSCCDTVTASVEWRASSGVLPDAACPTWTASDSAGATDPVLANGVLTLETAADGENMYFMHAPPHIATGPGTVVVIEATARLLSGSGSTPSRGPAGIQGSFGDARQAIHLFLEPGKIFITSDESVRGAEAAVDTSVMHTYRLEIDLGASSVKVSVDGAPTLAGSTFTGVNMAPNAIIWGEGSTFATGKSEWVSVKHNVYAACDGS